MELGRMVFGGVVFGKVVLGRMVNTSWEIGIVVLGSPVSGTMVFG